MDRLLILGTALMVGMLLLVVNVEADRRQQFALRMTQMGMCLTPGTTNWQPCVQLFQLPRPR